MTESYWHIQVNKSPCDKNVNGSCYCKSEVQLCRSDKVERRPNLFTRKPSLLKMTFWSRCLIALFLHIGCLAVDHRHRTSELPYEKDDLRLILGQSFPTSKLVGEESEASESIVSHGTEILSFHPFSLDFKESPLGMPRLGVVRVDNKLTDESVKLISISGSTVHFHSSFFADKIISPGSNTTFEVVFLSRAEGHVESHLYIHTSKGLFKYHVEGVGLPNPYRLKPLVGARIPVNGSYEPLITMHNPHGRRIQVVEILSSGSDFHLSLPDIAGDVEEEGAWAIEPFQTKPVMKGTFQGKAEGNHTGYIKIRVNSTTTASEYLLVPVEVQVSSSPGIYSPQESLDFGLLVRTDKPKTLSLSLINAQHLPVNVQSVSVKGDPNNAVRIEFRPIAIEQDSTVSTVVALVTFDPSEASSPKDSHGFLEIQSDFGDSITIPFRATVLNGELEFNSSSLGFFLKIDNYPSRNFSIRNTFPTAVAIYEVTLSRPDVIKLTNFNGNGSHVIHSGDQVDLFRMKVKKRGELCDLKSEIYLTLKTNVTNLKLPITCYDGKLQLHTLEGNEMKFGRVELLSSHVEYFAVGNLNPVEVRLKSWGSNISWALVDLVGMRKGDKEDLAKIQNFDGLKKSLFLQPGHMAVFSIEIRRPTADGVFFGEAFVTTDHNQTLRIPFNLIVSKGTVHSETILFDKVFPGKVSLEKLHLSSTFNQTLGVRNILSQPEGIPLWFTPISMQNLDLPPHRKTCVGKVHFDPKQLCGDECFSGFLLNSPMGQDWVRGSEISWETAKLDWNIFKILQKRFELVKDINLTNMTLWVDTSAANGFKVPTKVNYAWPRITASKVVVFPLTAIGNETFVDVPVYNPTNTPLFVHALMANDYGPNWVQHVQGNGVGGNLTEGALVFSLNGLASDASQSNEKSAIFTEVQRSVVGDFMDTKPMIGVSFVIPPSAKFYLRCRFKPISKQLTSTLLIVRNNLTGVETTWLKGRAGTGLLTLGSGTPGSSLLFQITEKLLQGCEKESASKYLPPQLTVRRSFVARNVGDIPLNIDLVEIYPPQGYYWPGSWTLKQGESCEGFGFRILNCNPFTLQPNETHSIDIAYTPDFTMSRMVRSLRLLDSNGVYYNYTLVAMIPSGMLGICSTIITRPSWEPALKLILFAAVIFVFMAASCLSYFDSSSIVSQAIVATVRVLPSQDSNQAVKEETKVKLDLKAVYDKVDSRFKRSQQELMSPQPSSTKITQGPTQASASGVSNQSLPTPPVTTSPTTTSSNSTRPEQPAGLRNRKKGNTRTATYLATELGSENTSPSEKWVKPEGAEEESRGSRDRQSSLSEDVSNNNVNQALELKKNAEVNGKKKGKVSVGKPKTVNKPTTSQTRNEDPGSGTERTISDVAENLPAPEPLPVITAVKSERKVPTKPTTSYNGAVEDGVEKVQKSLAKKSPKVNADTSQSPVTEQTPKVVAQPAPKIPFKLAAEFVPKASIQPPSKYASESSSKATNDSAPKQVFSTGTTHSEVKRTITSKQKQLSGSSSSGSHESGSPVDFPSRSGTPWLSSQDGLNDFGTVPLRQNSALQRRSSSGSGEGNTPQNFPSVPPGYNPIPSHAPQQPPGFYQQQFSSGVSYNTQHHQLQQMAASQGNSTYKNGNHSGSGTQNSSSRRPGVIGQPRQTGTLPPTSQPNLGFINGVLTTLSLTTHSNTPTYRQAHGQATRTPSWNSEIRALGMDNWTSRSSGELYPSSNIPFAKPPTSTPPPTNTNNDLYNFNSTLPSDLLSSLWQMNAFDPIPTASYRNAQAPGPSTAVTSSSSGYHRGFVSTSRPDTTSAHHSGYQQTQMENNWPSTTPASFYQNSSLEQSIRSSSPFMSQAQQSLQASAIGSGWSAAPAPPTARTSPFDRAEWEPLGNNSGRDMRAMNDIWQNTVPPSRTYWPSTITEAVSRPTTTNLISRPDPAQSTASGIGLQNQREIEAGLGFNPFGSNIWSPSDPAQGWSPPGSNRQ